MAGGHAKLARMKAPEYVVACQDAGATLSLWSIVDGLSFTTPAVR